MRLGLSLKLEGPSGEVLERIEFFALVPILFGAPEPDARVAPRFQPSAVPRIRKF